MTVRADLSVTDPEADRADRSSAVHSRLNEIVHNLEIRRSWKATWRGIRYLLENSEIGVNLKLKVFISTKKDIPCDLQRVPEFDQSQMFKKV